jgi:superfamily II DNA/RNA helicase
LSVNCYDTFPSLQPLGARQQTIMNPASFSSLPLSPAFLSNLDALGYQQMTPIQAQSLPQILAGGADCAGQNR